MASSGSRGWWPSAASWRRQRVDALADGRVFTGRLAGKAEGLIDELGGEDAALAWLKTEKKLGDGLEVLDRKPPKPVSERLLGAAIGSSVLDGLGLGGIARMAERAKLDGMLVLWHPAP